MKVGQDYFPKSSFLSIDKDLSLITKKIMGNQRLCKLLYYTSSDCLSKPDLTTEQVANLLGNQIRIIPKIDLKEDQSCPNYVLITFDEFEQNLDNPEFRDNGIVFSIVCHPDHWNLGDFKLRPYAIAGEIDSMLDKQKLTGIGVMQFLGASNLVLDEHLMGLNLMYKAIHGGEDKVNPLR